MVNIKCVLLVIVLLMIPQYNSYCRVLERDLNFVIREPEWIFVGELDEVSVGPILYDTFGALGKARVRVIRSLKGDPFTIGGESGFLEFLFRPDMGETPRLIASRIYLFFWKNTGAGPILLFGHYGARSIDVRGCVSTLLIEGLPATTSVAALHEIVRISVADNYDLVSSAQVKEVLEGDYCKDNQAQRPVK